MATSLKEIITDCNLKLAFEFFANNTEKVTLETVRYAFKSQKFDDELLSSLLCEVNSEGEFDFTQFKAIMFSLIEDNRIVKGASWYSLEER